MLTIAETDQEKRIELAIAEAAKRRDKYAEDRVSDLLKSLDGAADDVARQIRMFENKINIKQWQELRLSILKDLDKEIVKITDDLQKSWKVGVNTNVTGAMRLGIDEGLEQLSVLNVKEYQKLSDSARNKMVHKTFTTIDKSAIDFLANYQLTLLGDVSAELAAGIKRTVTQGILTGKSIPEVSRDIGSVITNKESFRKAGKTVFKTAQQRATLIARTETLRAHNEGRKVFYRSAGIKKAQWITANDERICPECGPLDGRIFDIDKMPGPPLHPACRCNVFSRL